jgi:hypothetical protein
MVRKAPRNTRCWLNARRVNRSPVTVGHRRAEGQRQRLLRLVARVQAGSDPLVVGAEFGHRGRRGRPVNADEFRADALLGHKRVEFGGGER